LDEEAGVMTESTAAAPPRASIVIPNWNGSAHLPECVAALRAQSFQDFEVLFVDNASSDASVEWIQQNAPGVTVIRRADNGGFAAAVNDGIRESCGDIVVLLNNDTAVHADWLGALVDALDAAPHYDAAASRMIC
jgi:GT2 family glycosyltransferase